MIGSEMSSKQIKVICALLIFCTTSVLCEYCHEKPGGLGTCGNRHGVIYEPLSSMSKDDAQTLLMGHEFHQRVLYSNKTSYTPWEWDSDLQLQAQRWAQQCINNDDKCRSIDKYKRVYQLTKRNYHGLKAFEVDRSKVIQEWFEELIDRKDDSKRAAIRFGIIDRIGCGYVVAMKSDCQGQKRFCSHGYNSYLVCRFASTSENN